MTGHFSAHFVISSLRKVLYSFNYPDKKMAAGEKGLFQLFGQTWVKILRGWTPGHLQG